MERELICKISGYEIWKDRYNFILKAKGDSEDLSYHRSLADTLEELLIDDFNLTLNDSKNVKGILSCLREFETRMENTFKSIRRLTWKGPVEGMK